MRQYRCHAYCIPGIVVAMPGMHVLNIGPAVQYKRVKKKFHLNINLHPRPSEDTCQTCSPNDAKKTFNTLLLDFMKLLHDFIVSPVLICNSCEYILEYHCVIFYAYI